MGSFYLQTPLTQDCPCAQTLPHAPQLLLSDMRSTQLFALQHTLGAAQAMVPQLQLPVVAQPMPGQQSGVEPMPSQELPPLHWHAPATQAELEHGTGVSHSPLASHVWTALPLHRVWAGSHIPMHAPPMHAWFAQCAAAPH